MKTNKKKSGWVYVAESTRPDGSKKLYVGKTKRNPKTRWGEHMKALKSKSNKTWTGRGTFFKPIGAVWSTNPDKAEKTVKKMSPAKKRSFGILGARRYGGWKDKK
ncbi:MAG: GIY-YIG nuclease family protein [Nanoarchaeota archaeon]